MRNAAAQRGGEEEDKATDQKRSGKAKEKGNRITNKKGCNQASFRVQSIIAKDYFGNMESPWIVFWVIGITKAHFGGNLGSPRITLGTILGSPAIIWRLTWDH